METSNHRSLSERVKFAMQQNALDADGAQWHSPMFSFVRLAKSDPELRHLGALAALQRVESSLKQICRESEDPWIACFPTSPDPRTEFVDTWDRIRLPAGTSVLDIAHDEAGDLPLTPIRAYSSLYCQFISLAGHLQRERPELTIKLPVEKISKLLGCDATTVSRLRQIAEREGLLKRIREHDFHRRRATEFHFNLDAFDWETGNQIYES